MELTPTHCARCRRLAPETDDRSPTGWVMVAQAGGRRAAVCAGCVTLAEDTALRWEALRLELSELLGTGGEQVDVQVDALIDRVRRAAIVVVKRRDPGHSEAADGSVASEVDLVEQVASEAALPVRVVDTIIRGLTA